MTMVLTPRAAGTVRPARCPDESGGSCRRAAPSQGAACYSDGQPGSSAQAVSFVGPYWFVQMVQLGTNDFRSTAMPSGPAPSDTNGMSARTVDGSDFATWTRSNGPVSGPLWSASQRNCPEEAM